VLKRSRNIKNSFWNLLNIGLYPVAFLALTPFFLRHLGEHLFGIWMLINSLVFIAVQIGHFGMGNSITMFVAESRGLDHAPRLNRFFNAALNFTLLVAGGVLLLCIVCWYAFPLFGSLMAINEVYIDDVHRALTLAITLISIRFFEQLFQGFFKGFEEYDTSAKFNISNKMLTLAGQVWVVKQGWDLTGIMLASIAVNTGTVVAQYIASASYLQNYRWSPTINKAIFSRLGGFGFWAWLQSMIALLSFQLDRFIVAFFLGTDVVAYYSLASMIANHLHMGLEALVSWMFPKISRFNNEGRDTASLYFTMRGVLLATSLLVIGGLFAVRQPLFTLWLGAEKYEQIIPFIEVFLYFEIFYVLSIAPKFYLNGLSRMRLITSLEFFYKSLSMLLMVLFFAVQHSATSLIWAQVAGLMIAMPVEAFVINSRVLGRNAFTETVLVVLPCFLMFFTLWVPSVAISLFLLVVTLVIMRFAYFDRNSFDRNLLME